MSEKDEPNKTKGGQNDEALKVFQRMYSMNTGNPPEIFLVKSLYHGHLKNKTEGTDSRRSMSIWDKTRRDWTQIKPLFQKPYLYQFLLITIIQFGSLFSLNTLRLWVRQLFTMIENFDYKNRDPSLGIPTLCDMISPTNLSNMTINADFNSTVIKTCVIAPVQSKVYIISIIIAVTSAIGITIACRISRL